MSVIQENKRQIVKYAIIVVVFAMLLSFTAFSNLREFAQSQMYLTGRGIVYITEFAFSKKAELHDQITELETERDELLTRLVEEDYTRQQNSELRELLSFYRQKPALVDRMQEANIIRSHVLADLDRFIIDIGARDGVDIGDPVIVSDGHLIGTIYAVNDFTAEVMMLQDIQSSVPARIVDEEGTDGLATGGGGFVLKLDYIPTQAPIEPGQILISKAYSDTIPAGLIIGTVQEVITQPSNPFKEAAVTPFVNVADYTTVSVLRSL